MNNLRNIQIHPDGKIDVHRREYQYRRQLEKLRAVTDDQEPNRDSILRFLYDCEIGKTQTRKQRRKIGAARCLKYLGLLRTLSSWFAKSFDDVTQADMESLVVRLDQDSLKTKSGRPFSVATKVDFRKALKKFWKWKDGNNKSYPPLVEWIDTFEPQRDFPALTRDEVQQMVDSTPNTRNKALVTVLFDSGARAEELLNVRLKAEHIYWKQENNCFMMRIEFSKTKPRTISLPLSTKYLSDWLKAHPAKGDAHAQLFPMKYETMRMLVYRLGRRALGKRVTPHVFRHSSATFYANKLRNQFQMCYRYGWNMASKEVNRYLDRAGIFEEESAKAVRAGAIESAEAENRSLKEEIAVLKGLGHGARERVSLLGGGARDAKETRDVLDLIAKLAMQQEEMARVLGEVSGRKFDVILYSDLVDDK